MIRNAWPRTPGGGGAPAATADEEPAVPAAGTADADPAGDGARAAGPAVPVVPLLALLLALLVAATVVLWSTRPEPSTIRTGDYVDALQAARAHVVDLTSFDHVTLDDDIREIEQVATGELGEETVAQLEERRQQILESEAVVSTEVVGAGITRADAGEATALLVIESTQKSNADEQAQLLRYRIEVELTEVDGRWLLSAIRGG
ncbi:hypothetical protein E9549_10130 [Blastococcus sp. MG754426]|uniref:hypothetical protein n=1 Tax=unclassified Blastococcus TaxID=2619396 RepID=UPI001EF0C4F0|nr:MULTISPECIES: hypothetical protein [unclassified Blastococcus]MCF6507758.1 hypothetical protein [Blastococcus sp. MG754426]MCF6512304.1 hypothetical protein [Blastococcus sp. MG754427]MCF6735254.1 hypothetical protein [Blastococcus sp. KM273129]